MLVLWMPGSSSPSGRVVVEGDTWTWDKAVEVNLRLR